MPYVPRNLAVIVAIVWMLKWFFKILWWIITRLGILFLFTLISDDYKSLSETEANEHLVNTLLISFCSVIYWIHRYIQHRRKVQNA